MVRGCINVLDADMKILAGGIINAKKLNQRGKTMSKMIDEISGLRISYSTRSPSAIECSAYNKGIHDALQIIRKHEQPEPQGVDDVKRFIFSTTLKHKIDNAQTGSCTELAEKLFEGIRPYLQTNTQFDEISIDVSTGENNAGLRAFAKMPPVEIMNYNSVRVAVFEGYLNEPHPTNTAQLKGLEDIREIIKFYADKANHSNMAPMEKSVWVDGGKKAREALNIINAIIGGKS